MRDISHDEVMADYYRDHPGYAVGMLNDILTDETAAVGELLVVLRQLAKAFGGVPTVAEKADLNPTQLYRTLSAKGNPSLSTLTALLRSMGMRLAVAPVSQGSGPAAMLQKPKRVRKKTVRSQESAPSKSMAAR